MVGRNLSFIAILVAAIAFPYYLSGDSQWTSVRSFWDSMWTDTVDGGSGAGQSAHWPIPNSNLPTATASPAPVFNPMNAAAALPTPPGSPLATKRPATAQQSYGWNNPAAGVAARNPINGAHSQTRPHDALSGQPSLCGPATPCISHLLNFEATPAWVMNNWQRVSTRLAEFEMEGLRVPVVTGTEAHDMVGSLTYHFDRRQVLQRIAFDGYTGDPGPLASIMMQKYGLVAEPWLGAGLYLARGGKDKQELVSVLRIRHAPVVRSDNPRQRYHVEFELNRPENELGLSSRFESLLERDRQQSVWQPEDEGTTTTTSNEAAADPATDEAAALVERTIREVSNSAANDDTNPYPSKSQLPINANRYLPPPP